MEWSVSIRTAKGEKAGLRSSSQSRAEANVSALSWCCLAQCRWHGMDKWQRLISKSTPGFG